MRAELAHDPVIWQPGSNKKQELFLAAPEDEVLYGGAAGGGKSDALLIDVLGLPQRALEYSTYRGILFRKTFDELSELVDRSREIYPQLSPGTKYNETRHEWTFPSGAKIRFRYFNHPKDRFKYQGHAYQYVGWDELTQHETSVGYEYLLTRLRAGGDRDRLKRYARATCNPGGFGHEWVKDRWAVPDEGSAVQFAVQLTDADGENPEIWHRRFIPARISDNEYLAGTSYSKQLSMTSNEMERRALLEGRWDVAEIVGAIYSEELEHIYQSGQVANIPIEKTIPVDTFWDLGRNDETAIWFMQQVGMERRFVHYEDARFKSITYWGKRVREFADKHNIVYNMHYMPHDVKVKQLSLNNQSREEMFEQVKVRPIEVVPRIESLQEGIELTREFMVNCYFDRAGCKKGLKALANYRRVYDEAQDAFKEEALKNWARNGADAFRQAAQGFSPIHKPRQRKRRQRTATAATM